MESEPTDGTSRTGASDGIDVTTLDLVSIDETAVDTTVFGSDGAFASGGDCLTVV